MTDENDTRLAKLAQATPSASPAYTLVMRMQTRVSRESVKASLTAIARLLRPAEAHPDLLSFPWHQTLNYQVVGSVRARLAEKYAPASANRHLSALRGVLTEAWKLGLLPAEELARALLGAERVEGYREPPGRMLTPGECRRMLEAASGRPGAQGLRDAAILAVGLGAGLRRHELVDLTVDGVLPSQEVQVIGKRNKQRTVPLAPWAWARVETWAQRRAKVTPVTTAAGQEPFFCGIGRKRAFSREGGTPQPAHKLSTSGMTYILNSIAEEAGITDSMTHNLRRTYISTLWDSDVDAASVAQLAGHSSVDTSIKYDRRGRERLVAAANKIPDPMQGGK